MVIYVDRLEWYKKSFGSQDKIKDSEFSISKGFLVYKTCIILDLTLKKVESSAS